MKRLIYLILVIGALASCDSASAPPRNLVNSHNAGAELTSLHGATIDNHSVNNTGEISLILKDGRTVVFKAGKYVEKIEIIGSKSLDS